MRIMLRLLILGMVLIHGNNGLMAVTKTTPIQCRVRGEKLLAPMTSAAICERFVIAFGRASGGKAIAQDAPPRDGLIVMLDFKPSGMAAAEVITVARGRRHAPAVFGLAISDRAFAAADIDQLAKDTVQGLHHTRRR